MADVVEPTGGIRVETHGVEVIADSERKGRPRDLFWPWFAANISVLGIGYGAWVLAFGISFGQAVIAGLIGITFSFALCGFVALAGKRGSAPTMTLSRAALGVNGNRVASGISWVLTVGWETVLTYLATTAVVTVFDSLGWHTGAATKVVAVLVVAALIIAGGVVGFDLIMRMQTAITVITAVLTIAYVAITWGHVDLAAVTALPSGSAAAFIGAVVFVMTGFGLGWVNMAADYSRYLPRSTSGAGVVGWTTFGAALAPLALLLFGLLLVGSDAALGTAISTDPIAGLVSILPSWFLVPFLVVAILGFVGGAVLDIYSSGIALISTGLPVKRPVAAGIDGVIMVLGTLYLLFGADSFFYPFQGFLITLGVPIAAWAGIFLADVLIRRADYDVADLFRAGGRYRSVDWTAIGLLVVGTVVGWGLVVNTYAGWLGWQGYLMGLIGGKGGSWTSANVGVLIALVIGFVGGLVRTGTIRRQESTPPTQATLVETP
ncbi:MAG: cytosine permease [Cellulomonas sp.]|nr:cytosine permease [Cellulomonas sp.]